MNGFVSFIFVPTNNPNLFDRILKGPGPRVVNLHLIFPVRFPNGILRGSGYLGYVDSNQGYNPISGWPMSPNPRVIDL